MIVSHGNVLDISQMYTTICQSKVDFTVLSSKVLLQYNTLPYPAFCSLYLVLMVPAFSKAIYLQ